MKINREQLVTTLQLAKPGLAGTGTLEQAEAFIFTDGQVVTYNDEICVRCPIKGLDVEGAVPAKRLHQLLQRITDDEVTVQVSEGGAELLVQGRRPRAGLKMQAEVSLPIDEAAPPAKGWLALPETFTDDVGFALDCASTDENKPALTCVHVVGDTVEACDNRRVSRITMPGADMEDMMIPAKAARYLSGYPVLHYVQSEGWLHFRTKHMVTFSCRTLKANYPDLNKILDLGKDHQTPVQLPASLGDVLQRATVLQTVKFEWEQMVTVKLAKDKLTIRCTGDEGWFEEDVRVPYKGNALSFITNPAYMAKMLETTTEVLVRENTVLFITENVTHLVATVGEE